MSDTTYSAFQHYGTAAERASFTPDPASGIQPLYIWRETDTGNVYLYDTSWHLLTGSSALQTASVTLTDAQIKALPTTPQTLVAAQGANTAIVPHLIFMASSFAAGAYTNINAAAYGWCEFSGGAVWSNYLANDAAEGLADFSNLFGSTTRRRVSFEANTFTVAESAGWGAVAVVIGLSANELLRLTVDNGGSGDLTGGNAANTLQIVTYYTVEAV